MKNISGFVIEVDKDELELRIAEAIMGICRPLNTPAIKVLRELSETSPEFRLISRRTTETVQIYLTECVENSKKIQ